DGCTNDGGGTGSFVSSLTGLTSETSYYVRAYAMNPAGTAYGSDVQFTTLAEVVDVPTLNEWSMLVFMVLTSAGAILRIRRRKD
ncbi:MAG: IPTL-CTERM sorting domain-containing protein, partial [Pseudomonadota bacterium]